MGSFAEQRKKNRLTRETEDTTSFREERLKRVNLKEKSKTKMTEEPELRDENMYDHMQNMENLVRTYGNRAKEWTPSIEPKIEDVNVEPVRTPFSGFKEQMLIGKQNMEHNAAKRKRATLGQGTDEGFLRYDEIQSQPDYQKNVEAGRNRKNIFNSQPESLVDYLDKDVWINERVRANDSYAYMNETEKDLYSYLVGKYGAKSGADYIESIRPELNKRATEKIVSDKRTQAETNGDAALGDYVHSALTGYMRAPLAIGKQAYNNVFKGGEALDPNDPVFRSEQEKEALREGFKENTAVTKAVPDEGLRSFGVDTGLSMLDSVTRLPMGYLGLGAAAGSAAASGMQDALGRGGSGEQALLSGLASGTWEYAAEKAGFDRLKGLKLNPATSAREYIKNIAKQGATEGLEEAVTEIANTASDAVIMQELSQVNLDYERYLALGMGEAEARAQAVKDMVSRVGLAAAGGAVSGGVMGGGAQTLGLGAQELYYRDTGRRINPDYRDYAEGIDTDVESYADVADQERAIQMQQWAQEYADRQRNGEFISNRDKGRYETELERFVGSLQEKAQAQHEKESAAEMQQEEIDAEANAAEDVTKMQQDEQEMQMVEEQNQQTEPIKAVDSDIQKPVKTPNIEFFNALTDNSSDTQNNGQETENLNAQQVNSEHVVDDSISAWSDVYGKNGRKAFEEMYDGESDIAAYYKGFVQYYNAGRYNMDEKTAEQSAASALLDHKQAAAAFKAGIADRNAESGYDLYTLQPNRLIQGEKKTGGITYAAESATDAQKKAVDYIGKKTGLKFELVDEAETPEAIASYLREKGTVRIRTDAENFNAAISHELTHFIQDYSPDNYQVYQDTVVQAITEAEGVDLETLISRKIDQYAEAGQEINRAEAVDEIVANATESFLNDEAFINRIVQKDKTLGEKIKDFIEDVIEALTSLIKTGSVRTEAKALEQNLSKLKKAKLMWKNGLEAASERYKLGWEADTKADHDERYALKNPDQLTNEILEQNYTYVRNMEPIATLNGNEFEGKRGVKTLTEAVKEYYDSIGNMIHNDIVGDILLSRRSVKDDIAHGYNDIKAITFKAVPEVLEKGKVLQFNKDWKSRGYDTAVIGGKIKVADGKYAGDYYQICIVKVDANQNRMYLHEVQVIKTDGSIPFKTWTVNANGLPSGNTPSIYSIFDKLSGVNEKQTKPKIRFQLKEPVEETKNLIAVHNLTEDKLLKAFQYEGIPMPSIAITKADIGHENFGDISLLFTKDTIDPKKKKNKVYGADAWTPTFPKIEYETDLDVSRNIAKKVRNWSQNIPENYRNSAISEVSGLEYTIDNYGGKAGLIEKAMSSTALKATFLASKGQVIEQRIKEERTTISDTEKTIYTAILDQIGHIDYEDTKKSGRAIYDTYGSRIEAGYVEGLVRTGADRNAAEIHVDGMKGIQVVGAFRKAYDYQENGGVKITRSVDYDAMQKDIAQRLDPKEYKKWLEELFEGIEKDSGVYNGKDIFTPSGNRRSFKQTHLKVTAENIVKAMLAQSDDVRNVSGFNGVKSIRAVATEDFKSIKQIKEASAKLKDIDSDEYEARNEELSRRLYNIMENILDQSNGGTENRYISMDNIGFLILDACSNPSVDNICGIMNQYGWKITGTQAQELAEIIQEVKNMPVNMFEAKPQRVVGYDEIAAAVVPEDVSEEVLKALDDKGIKVLTYDAEDKSSRAKVVNSVEGIRFQLEDVEFDKDPTRMESLIRENENLKEANELLQKQFELTGAKEVDAHAVQRIAEKILERYQSGYNTERLSENIQKLYHSIWINQNVRNDEVLEAASAIGRSILKKSTHVDHEFAQQYDGLKKKIKNTKLSISEMDRSDLEREGGYNNFKKANAGRMRIGNGGISVDSFYQELTEEHPELFSKEITHPADQLIEIADVLDFISSQLKNPYHATMDEMSLIVGHEILDEYFDIKRDEQPTFADIKEAEIKRVRKQYSKRIAKYKTSIDMKYREKLKSLNTRYAEEKASLKEKQVLEREAMWKRYREKVQSHRDYQQGRHDKQIIIKEVNKLRKWLLEPSKDHYIPDALRVTIAEFLKDINFSSNRTNEDGSPTQRTLAWEEAEQMFEKIINAGGIVKEGNHQEFWYVDPSLADKIRELRKEMTLLSKFDNMEPHIPKLDDMEPYQLSKLKEIVYAVRSALYNANRLSTLEKAQKVNEFAGQMYQELDELKEKKKNLITTVPDRMMNYEMLDSLTMFEQFGEHGKRLYSSIREGLDRKTVKLEDTEEFIKKTLDELEITSEEIKSWERGEEAIKKFRIGTREVTLTTAQIMELYELSKEKQGKKHLYSDAGGITPGPIATGFKADLKGDKKRVELPAYLEQHHVRLTEADVKRITGNLTEKQRKLADAMQQYMEKTCAAWGNEVHRQLNGYERFKTKGYYPLKVDQKHTKQNDERPGELTIEHMGLTKSREESAGNPLMVNSIFETFSDHVDRMSSYYGYVLALSDARKILNYKDFEMGGSIYEQISKVFGKAGLDYVNGLFKDINGSINTDRSIMEKAISSMKASAVSGNLRVAVQQPTAYIRAAAEIDAKYLAKGMRSEKTKTLWPKVCKYAPIAQWKEWGFYQMQTSRQLKDIMFGTETAMQKATDKFMWLTSMGDKATWCRIWTACEYETLDTHPELKKGSEEFYEQVGKRFSDIIDRTQVVDSVLHRTQIMRSKNMLNKMATDFMGEPLKNYNMLYRAAMGLSNHKKGVSLKEFWKNNQKEQKRALRIAAVYVAQVIVVSLAASSIDVLRDDDRDKNLIEKYKTHVWDNLKSGLNPVGSIPYAKDLLSISQGYKVLRTDMSIYQDLYYSMREMEKLWKGESPRTPAWVIQNSVRAVSKLFGLPVNSVMRDAGALIDTAMNCYGGGADYTWLKQQYAIGSKENLTMYASVLLEAQRAGNKELSDKIKNELNQAGYSNDDISAKIKSIVKAELVSKDFVHPQIEAAAQAKIKFDTKAYESAAKALGSEGYTQKMIASAVKTRVGQLTGDEDETDPKSEIKVSAEEVVNEGIGAGEDEELEDTLYDSSDLERAIEQIGNTRESLKAFETVANSIVDSKVAAGEKRSKAISSLKSTITRKYKEKWIEADNKKRIEIQNKLKYLKVGTTTLYSTSDWNRWLEDSKKK